MPRHVELHNLKDGPGSDFPFLTENFHREPASGKPETVYSNTSTPSDTTFLPQLKLELPGADNIYEAAEAIRKATCKDSLIDTGTYENKIFSVLESLTEKQRVDLRQVYKIENSISLEDELRSELSGRDLEKAMNLLSKKDGTTDNAGFVRELVTELNHVFQGRTRDSIAEALRQKLVTMSSSNIDAMNKDYFKRYGVTAYDDLMNQGRLSETNKDVLKIYFKGTDRTGDSDMVNVAKIALDSGNLEIFTEAMSHTSPIGRKQFAQTTGNVETLERAFKSSLSQSTEEAMKIFTGHFGQVLDRTSGDQAVLHALDYIKFGKLSAPTQIIESSGWTYDNEQSIETALNTMSAEERSLYKTGARLAAKPDTTGFTQEEKDSVRYYKSLRSALSRVGNSCEISRWDDLAKVQGGSHEKKMISDLLRENLGFFGNNRPAIVDGLLNLNEKEIQQYKSNKDYQKRIDGLLELSLGGGSVYSKSAKHILGEIKKGEKGEDDIIVKLYRHASYWDADDAEVVRTVESAFKADKDLQRKIVDPRTKEEESYSNKFKDALKSALGSDFQTYGAKLLAEGRLSIKNHTDLCQGFVYVDVASMAKSVFAADEDEKRLLLSNDNDNKLAMELQEHIFGDLWEEQSDYIKTVLNEDRSCPEDTVRSFVVGGGATGKEVLELLSSMDAKEQAKLNVDYVAKYNSCLIDDLLDHLSTEESGLLPSVVKTEGATLESMYNEYLNRYTTSKDGIGEWFVNEHWDATGYQAEEAINHYSDALRQSNGNLEAVSEQRHREMAQNIAETLHNFTLSKRAAGEAVGNVAIVAAAVAASPFTSGLSLSLLAKLTLFGAAGAAIKISTGAAFNGADYTSTQLAMDGGTGFVSGAMMALGPRELAQLAQVGSNVGTSAAGLTIDGLALLSEKAGESVLKEGSNKLIEKTFIQLVQQAIMTNSDDVPIAALESLASQVATKGNERVVQMSFELALQKATQEATANLLAVKTAQYGLPTLAGGASGTLSGGISGAAQWDSRDPVGKNIERIGVSAIESGVPSALVAFSTTASIDVLSGGLRPIKTQNEFTRDRILSHYLDGQNSSSEADALFQTWNKDALSNSIAANQERFRQAVANNTAVVAKKQLYQVQFDKVTEDTTIHSLEDKFAPAKAGQWIATRLNPDGTPNIENGIKNSWVVDSKTVAKSYQLGSIDDLESAQLTLWTKTDAPPVVALEAKDSGRFMTPWGSMNYSTGDRFLCYDYDSLANSPGTNFGRVTASSWRQTYEVVPMKPERLADDGLNYGMRYISPLRATILSATKSAD